MRQNGYLVCTTWHNVRSRVLAEDETAKSLFVNRRTGKGVFKRLKKTLRLSRRKGTRKQAGRQSVGGKKQKEPPLRSPSGRDAVQKDKNKNKNKTSRDGTTKKKGCKLRPTAVHVVLKNVLKKRSKQQQAKEKGTNGLRNLTSSF